LFPFSKCAYLALDLMYFNEVSLKTYPTHGILLVQVFWNFLDASYNFFFFWGTPHIESNTRRWNELSTCGEKFGGKSMEEKGLASSCGFKERGEMYLNLKFFNICKGAMLKKRVKTICKIQDKKKIEFGNLGWNEGCNTSWTNLKKIRNMESLGLKCKVQHKLKTKKYNFWGL